MTTARVATWATALVVLAVTASGCLGPMGPAAVDPYHPGWLVWGGSLPVLRVQVDHVEGRAPSAFALAALEATLRQVSDKRAVIVTATQAFEDPHGSGVYGDGFSSVTAFHEHHYGTRRHAHVDGESALLHVLYLDGVRKSSSGGLTFGAFTAGDIVIFADAIRQAEGGLPRPGADRVERAVLIHELGHALGLVGCGAPVTKTRQTDGCHSANEESVMGPRVSDAVVSVALDSVHEGSAIPYRFDADDLNDIAALRAQERR